MLFIRHQEEVYPIFDFTIWAGPSAEVFLCGFSLKASIGRIEGVLQFRHGIFIDLLKKITEFAKSYCDGNGDGIRQNTTTLRKS